MDEAERIKRNSSLLWVVCRAISAVLTQAFQIADGESLDRAVVVAWIAHHSMGDLIAQKQSFTQENFYQFVTRQEHELEQLLRECAHEPGVAV